MNLRALAAKAIFEVLEKGVSLSVALPEQQKHLASGKDKALLARALLRCDAYSATNRETHQ